MPCPENTRPRLAGVEARARRDEQHARLDGDARLVATRDDVDRFTVAADRGQTEARAGGGELADDVVEGRRLSAVLRQPNEGRDLSAGRRNVVDQGHRSPTQANIFSKTSRNFGLSRRRRIESSAWFFA
jgi:hypothetical protein